MISKFWKFLVKSEPESAFIIGCGHSGTSILMRILGEHSAIYAIPGETELFLTGKSEKEIRETLSSYNEETAKAGKRLWVEKTPKHVIAIDSILKYLPNAKFIALGRDPRDVACSLKGRGWSFEKGLRRWVEDNTHLYHRRAAANVHRLRLEDLIRSPEEEIERVLAFLALPNENLLDYHQRPKDWYTGEAVRQKPENELGPNHLRLRNWQINSPLFKTTDRHSTEMTGADQVVFQQCLPAIIPLAKFWGYEFGEAPSKAPA